SPHRSSFTPVREGFSDRLLENRAERGDDGSPFVSGRIGGIAEIGLWTAGFGERFLAPADGFDQRMRVRRELRHQLTPDQARPLGQDDRSFVAARVARAALKL